MSTRLKTIVAGSLLAVTAIVLGLTMTVFMTTNAADSSAVAAQASTVNSSEDEADLMALVDVMAHGFGPGMGRGVANSPETQGKITKVENNGDKITVGNRVVNISGTTVIGDANGTLTKDKLKVGDRVSALGTAAADNSLNARWVLVLPTLPEAKTGTVTSVSGNDVKFKLSNGEEWTATLKSDGKVYINGTEGKIADIKANDRVVAFGNVDATAKTVQASQIVTGMTKQVRVGMGATGKVKSVDAANNTFTVTQTARDGTTTDLKVTVDANTKYSGDLKSLADLKTDQQVFVIGEKQSDGSVKATAVGTGRMGGPGGPRGRPGGNGFGMPFDDDLKFELEFFMEMHGRGI
jgi:Domain of unknown function (DUF5666)